MQKREMVLVAVPADLLHEAGICEGCPCVDICDDAEAMV